MKDQNAGKVLIIMLPLQSHYNISFGYANYMKKKGYEVTFGGLSSSEDYICSQGFTFLEMEYINEYGVLKLSHIIALSIKTILDKKFLIQRYREFLRVVKVIVDQCKRENPNIIYIDEHLSFYFILLKPYFRNVVILNTKLPTHRVSGIPPLTCSKVFSNNIYYKFLAFLKWEVYVFNQKKYFLKKKIAFLGKDEKYFFSRLMSKNSSLIGVEFTKANLLHFGLKNVPIIHLVPRQLEYKWYKLTKWEQFFYTYYPRKEQFSFESFWMIVNPILKEREKSNTRIVFASLGTLSSTNSRTALIFLKRLIDAFADIPNAYLIISSQELFAIQDITFPNNILLFQWVPQIEILKYCNLMITHGGTNSILECIEVNVPMIVYPLNLKADHSGNAARVVYNKWGQKGNIRKDGVLNIHQKIAQMLITFPR